MHWKMTSGKWRLICFGLNVLMFKSSMRWKGVCGTICTGSIIQSVYRIATHVFVSILWALKTEYNQNPLRIRTSIAIISTGGINKKSKSFFNGAGRCECNHQYHNTTICISTNPKLSIWKWAIQFWFRQKCLVNLIPNESVLYEGLAAQAPG